MASPSTPLLWIQAWSTFKTYSIPITLGLIVCNLLWNKFQPGLVKIPGPTLAAYSKFWRLYDVYKGHAHLTAIDLHRQYGPLVRIAPNHVSVADPKMIPVIYTNKEDFTKVCYCSVTQDSVISLGGVSLTRKIHRLVSTRSNASRGRSIQR